MLRVGLTGGIACGKSHVLRRLAAHGLATADLDSVAHELMAPGGATYGEIVAAFGREILGEDGAIDRRALGELVFADAAARARLDAIVHPRVRQSEEHLVAALAAEGRSVIVSDAALLVEVGIHLRFDRLVVVHCDEADQRRRLMERDGLGEAAARARIEAQMPVREKRLFGHYRIDTSGTVPETEARADALASELLALAGRPRERLTLPADRARAALVHGEPGPRGLDARSLLESVVEADGVEMQRLAGRLAAAVPGPWYRQARGGESAPWPEALACAVAVIAAARGFADAEWVAAVASSLARLTHPDPEAVAGGVVAALAALAVSRSGRIEPGLPSRLSEWARAGERWSGAAPPPRLAAGIRAAVRHPVAPQAARAEAAASGAEPALAGGLVGLAVGLPAGPAPPGIAELVARLGFSE